MKLNRRHMVAAAGVLAGVLVGWALVKSPLNHRKVSAFIPWLQPKLPEYLHGPDLAWCVASDSSKYRMVIEPQGDEPCRRVTLHVLDGDEEVFNWTGSPAVPFARAGDKLYLADFNPMTSGCSVLAYDLAGRKQMWRRGVKRVTPSFHSFYINSVTIQLRDGVVRIHGVESNGEYIDELDAKTGATVWYRILWQVSE